ncbi:unnamed protein product, partial [Tetraodon nigroviridis]
KVLKELIEPYSLRVERLQEFLQDVKPLIQVEIVPLEDPYGISVADPHLECIVVSEETKKGGEAVNKKRKENGLSALVLHEIQLLKDSHHSETEEEKISSSSLRSRLLGTLLSPPIDTPHLPALPYVIGLTGGSGSGKSSIARHLEALGAIRIDCDQLGHEAYQPGTVAYHRVLEEFGSDLTNEDKTINRRALGRKVFGNKERLKALTDIVWPEIALLVKDKIRQAKEDGKQVCVVDAAVLLEAGWTDMVHEVWVTIIPDEEVKLYFYLHTHTHQKTYTSLDCSVSQRQKSSKNRNNTVKQFNDVYMFFFNKVFFFCSQTLNYLIYRLYFFVVVFWFYFCFLPKLTLKTEKLGCYSTCVSLVVFFFQAVTRITERDGVSSEDALRRLQSQWSNAKQVEHANVVLSTLWEPEVTRKQVRRSL